MRDELFCLHLSLQHSVPVSLREKGFSASLRVFVCVVNIVTVNAFLCDPVWLMGRSDQITSRLTSQSIWRFVEKEADAIVVSLIISVLGN